MSLLHTVYVLLLFCKLSSAAALTGPSFVNFQSILLVEENAPINTTIALLSASNPNGGDLLFAIRSLAALTVIRLIRVSAVSANITLSHLLNVEVTHSRIPIYYTLSHIMTRGQRLSWFGVTGSCLIDARTCLNCAQVAFTYSILFEVRDSTGYVTQRFATMLVQQELDSGTTTHLTQTPFTSDVTTATPGSTQITGSVDKHANVTVTAYAAVSSTCDCWQLIVIMIAVIACFFCIIALLVVVSCCYCQRAREKTDSSKLS